MIDPFRPTGRKESSKDGFGRPSHANPFPERCVPGFMVPDGQSFHKQSRTSPKTRQQNRLSCDGPNAAVYPSRNGAGCVLPESPHVLQRLCYRLDRAAASGRGKRLRKLHGRYWPWLVELAKKKMKGARLRAVDQEDVAQQAFWSFYRTFKAGGALRLANRHDFLALLTTITACKAINPIQHEVGVHKRGGGQVQGESYGHRPVRSWCLAAHARICLSDNGGANRRLRAPKRRASNLGSESPPRRPREPSRRASSRALQVRLGIPKNRASRRELVAAGSGRPSEVRTGI